MIVLLIMSRVHASTVVSIWQTLGPAHKFDSWYHLQTNSCGQIIPKMTRASLISNWVPTQVLPDQEEYPSASIFSFDQVLNKSFSWWLSNSTDWLWTLWKDSLPLPQLVCLLFLHFLQAPSALEVTALRRDRAYSVKWHLQYVKFRW